MIKSKALRKAYASELWQMRELMRDVTPAEKWGMRLGLESGIWAAQKIIMLDMQ
jgi:hypothetical protein